MCAACDITAEILDLPDNIYFMLINKFCTHLPKKLIIETLFSYEFIISRMFNFCKAKKPILAIYFISGFNMNVK